MKFFYIFAFILLVTCQLSSAGLWDDIKGIGKKAEEIGKNAVSSIAEGSAKVVDKIKDQLNQKQPTLDEVKESIKNMANEIADSSSKVVDAIKNEIGKAANNEEIQKVITSAQEKIDEATHEVEGDLKKVGDKLKEIFEFIKNKKNELTENPPTLDQIKQVVEDMGNEIADTSSVVFDNIRSEIEHATNVDEIKKVIAAAQQKVENTATEVEGGLNNVADKLQEILDSIKNKN